MTDLVRTGEAAEAVGVPVHSLTYWAKKGHLTPALRTPGGRYMWDIEDLRRQLLEWRGWEVEEPRYDPNRPPKVAAVVVSPRGALFGRRKEGSPWKCIATEVENESIRDAAKRAVREVAGLEVQTGSINICRHTDSKTGQCTVYMGCLVTGSSDVAMSDSSEFSELRWLDIQVLSLSVFDLPEEVRTHLMRLVS